jgi:hypothetical protein
MMTYIIMKTLILTVSVILIGIGAELGISVILLSGLGIGAAIGSVTVLRAVLFPKENWSLCGLHGGAVIASYYGGALFTMITFGTEEILQSGYTAYSDPGLIFFAALLIALYALLLVMLGLYEHTHWRRLFMTLADVPLSQTIIAGLLIVMALLQAYLLVTGRVSFMGFATSETGETPAFEQLITRLSTPILGVCGYILGDRDRRFGMFLFWLCIALVPLEMVWTTAFGRRVIVYSFTAMIGAFFWSRGSLSLNFRALILIGGGLTAVYMLANLFVTIRLEQNPLTARLSQTMFDHLGSASDKMQAVQSEVLQAHFRNLQTRFYVIGYLSDLIGGTRPGSALLGLGLLSSIVLIIPSFLFPGKAQFLAELGKDEVLVNPRFGLPVSDNAISGLTMAYADFLWLGVILYPLVMMVLAIIVAKVIGFVQDQVLRVYLMGFGLILFLTTEETMTFYFVGIRTLLFIMVSVAVGRLMLGPKRPVPVQRVGGYRSGNQSIRRR